LAGDPIFERGGSMANGTTIFAHIIALLVTRPADLAADLGVAKRWRPVGVTVK